MKSSSNPRRVVLTPIIAFIWSGVMAMVSIAMAFAYRESHVNLTYMTQFTNFSGLSAIIQSNATTYFPVVSPSLSAAAKGNLSVKFVNDTASQIAFWSPNETAPASPGALFLLLNTSNCRLPTARDYATPLNQTSGCSCIVATYAAFAGEVFQAGGGANFSTSIRQAYAGSIVSRCKQLRFVWRSDQCGKWCRVHPSILTYYLNVVMFLASGTGLLLMNAKLAIELFSDEYKYTMSLIIILLTSVSLSIPMFFVHGWSNICLICGVAIVGVTLMFTINRETVEAGLTQGDQAESTPDTDDGDDGSGGQSSSAADGKANQYSTCLISTVHTALPAYLMMAAITNFLRDYAGVSVLAAMGMVQGYAVQRMFWTSRYATEKAAGPLRKILFLLACFLTTFGVFAVYGYMDTGPVFSAAPGSIIAAVGGFPFLFIMVTGIGRDSKSKDASFGFDDMFCYAGVIAANTLLTWCTFNDVQMSG